MTGSANGVHERGAPGPASERGDVDQNKPLGRELVVPSGVRSAGFGIGEPAYASACLRLPPLTRSPQEARQATGPFSPET
jgi:hypothetical protein